MQVDNYAISSPREEDAEAAVDASSVDVKTIRASADRLNQLAQQMQQFLEHQISRIEEYVSTNPTPSGELDEQQRQQLEDAFQRRQYQWEEECAEEKARLREESQRLVKAWKQLEAEQRETLKMRALNGEQLGRYGANASETRPVKSRTTQPSPQVPAQPVAAADSKMPTSRQGTAQFQQLRREMLEHARQRRKR